MTEQLNRITKEALAAATGSLRELAEEAGLHYVTLTRWRTLSANVSTGSALKLAEVLEKRAATVAGIAVRLRAQAELEQEGGDDE